MADTPSTPGARLRTLLATSSPVIAPGAANALSARIVADCGFAVVYVSGAGIANWSLGVPDLGLTSMSEVVAHVAHICSAVDVPVIADADTGYGNALNVTRTVREFERAGVAAIQLEDQVDPKRCGHFEGKEVVPIPEMVAKLHATVDARRDPGLVIIARTDARAVEGLSGAIDRAHAYREAGADAIFVEAPIDEGELARIGAEVPGPLVANMVEGGKTPILPSERLSELGFALVIYANVAARAAMKAMHDVLSVLRREGTSASLEDRIVTMAERNRLTGMDEWRGLEERFSSE
jgi:2-methylisocitrate lyase-like PEP mutase family enzyme